jgi:parallel beta-helix repeat protein
LGYTYTWNNALLANVASGSIVGFHLGNSSNRSLLMDNLIRNNNLGANIVGSVGNVLYNNTFEDNDYFAYDDSQNQWDDGN